jgi:histidinol dehydrogenase
MIKVFNAKTDEMKIQNLVERSQMESDEINATVQEIVETVRAEGDDALKKYTQMYDGVSLDELYVTQEDFIEAKKNIDPELTQALKRAIENIRLFHKKQRKRSFKFKKDADIILGQLVNPIEKVGIYVPGGTASYPSTVMMNVIPAQLAGVKDIVITTPVGKDGKVKDSVLVAADLLGIQKIVKVGGAQAIAALAYGTQTIEKVDKIVGPGNIYVAMAKRRVSGRVGIDMIAGPSEVVIIADDNANPIYIAADMIAQAEHDPMAASILITESEKLGKQVTKELLQQLDRLDRKTIAEQSLSDYGAIIITDCKNDSFDLANKLAPEHLELLTKNPFDDYKKIKNAGAIFLGEYSPEPVGDYYAGPNHTLPTSRTARFSSALSVDDFYKKTSLIYYSKEALGKAQADIIRLAEDEQLSGHANAIAVRMAGE